MKTTKLMLSAFAAVLAMVSCNKQDTTPEMGSRTLKSVEVSLENVIMTKSSYAAAHAVKAGSAIKVNDFQIFLLDESGNEYTGKVADGSADAQSYWDAGMPLDGKASFHYVDPKCTKVVAVANMRKQFDSYADLLTELATDPIEIRTQQDPDAGIQIYQENIQIQGFTTRKQPLK